MSVCSLSLVPPRLPDGFCFALHHHKTRSQTPLSPPHADPLLCVPPLSGRQFLLFFYCPVVLFIDIIRAVFSGLVAPHANTSCWSHHRSSTQLANHVPFKTVAPPLSATARNSQRQRCVIAPTHFLPSTFDHRETLLFDPSATLHPAIPFLHP